jgi:hypothetical protein
MENKTAFAVFATGTDYYDRPELVSLFSTREAAEAFASELRLVKDEYLEDELYFDKVVVEMWEVK